MSGAALPPDTFTDLSAAAAVELTDWIAKIAIPVLTVLASCGFWLFPASWLVMASSASIGTNSDEVICTCLSVAEKDAPCRFF